MGQVIEVRLLNGSEVIADDFTLINGNDKNAHLEAIELVSKNVIGENMVKEIIPVGMVQANGRSVKTSKKENYNGLRCYFAG